MVIVAVLVLNAFHPGYCLGKGTCRRSIRTFSGRRRTGLRTLEVRKAVRFGMGRLEQLRPIELSQRIRPASRKSIDRDTAAG